jgi:hypothetical protein
VIGGDEEKSGIAYQVNKISRRNEYNKRKEHNYEYQCKEK